MSKNGHSVEPLRELFDRCLSRIRQQPISRAERVQVIHQAAHLYAEPEPLKSMAWNILRAAARDAYRVNSAEYMEDLRIGLFELLPQSPTQDEDVQRLFDCLDDPETRWVPFHAYQRAPRTFARHIAQYGNGRISNDEYAQWLGSQNLIITDRGLRIDHKA